MRDGQGLDQGGLAWSIVRRTTMTLFEVMLITGLRPAACFLKRFNGGRAGRVDLAGGRTVSVHGETGGSNALEIQRLRITATRAMICTDPELSPPGT